ncbi:MAG: hypothetical protein M8357_01615 [Desulfobulbaceae bacterium]|nr:hypothetical protein [Desulfobulbaceae bacterium]
MTTIPRLAYIFPLIFFYAMWILPAFAAVPIQRISLADALFVGQTTTIPPSPVLLHSITDFENNYGKLPPDGLGTLYELWIAVASFFEQGGENLYIAPLAGDSGPESYRQALNGFNAAPYIGLIAAPG